MKRSLHSLDIACGNPPGSKKIKRKNKSLSLASKCVGNQPIINVTKVKSPVFKYSKCRTCRIPCNVDIFSESNLILSKYKIKDNNINGGSKEKCSSDFKHTQADFSSGKCRKREVCKKKIKAHQGDVQYVKSRYSFRQTESRKNSSRIFNEKKFKCELIANKSDDVSSLGDFGKDDRISQIDSSAKNNCLLSSSLSLSVNEDEVVQSNLNTDLSSYGGMRDGIKIEGSNLEITLSQCNGNRSMQSLIQSKCSTRNFGKSNVKTISSLYNGIEDVKSNAVSHSLLTNGFDMVQSNSLTHLCSNNYLMMEANALDNLTYTEGKCFCKDDAINLSTMDSKYLTEMKENIILDDDDRLANEFLNVSVDSCFDASDGNTVDTMHHSNINYLNLVDKNFQTAGIHDGSDLHIMKKKEGISPVSIERDLVSALIVPSKGKEELMSNGDYTNICSSSNGETNNACLNSVEKIINGVHSFSDKDNLLSIERALPMDSDILTNDSYKGIDIRDQSGSHFMQANQGKKIRADYKQRKNGNDTKKVLEPFSSPINDVDIKINEETKTVCKCCVVLSDCCKYVKTVSKNILAHSREFDVVRNRKHVRLKGKISKKIDSSNNHSLNRYITSNYVLESTRRLKFITSRFSQSSSKQNNENILSNILGNIESDIEIVWKGDDSGAYKCEWHECSYKFDKTDKLINHLKEHHIHPAANNQIFICLWRKCKFSNQPSSSYKWLSKHVLRHCCVKPFRCVISGCEMSFGTQSGLARHVPSHFNEGNVRRTCILSGTGKTSHQENRSKIKMQIPQNLAEYVDEVDESADVVLKKSRYDEFVNRYEPRINVNIRDENILNRIKCKLLISSCDSMQSSGYLGNRFRLDHKIVGKRTSEDGSSDMLISPTITALLPHRTFWVDADKLRTQGSMVVDISMNKLVEDVKQILYDDDNTYFRS